MRRLLLLVLLVMAASGCQAGSRVVVHPDGSGTYSVVLTAPAGKGDTGERLYAAMRKAAARSAVPMTVERHTENSEDGVQASFDFRSLADLHAEAAAMGGASDPLAGVTVGRNATGWAFSASSADGLTRPPGQPAGGNAGGPIDATGVAGLVRMTVSVQLPGAPGKTNADAVRSQGDLTTFSWDLKAGRAPGPLAAQTTFLHGQAAVPAAQGLTTLLVPNAAAASPSAASATPATATAPPATLDEATPAGGTASAGPSPWWLALTGSVAALLVVGAAVVRRRRAPAVPV